MNIIRILVVIAMFSVLLAFFADSQNKELQKSANVIQKPLEQMTSTKVHGKTMGTFYSINVVGGFSGGEKALSELAENAFIKICKEISTFDSNAELARFNAFKSTEPFEISNELAKILVKTVYQCKRIDGGIDITVGPLVNLWGFGVEKANSNVSDKDANDMISRIYEVVPSKEQIEETLKYVGLDKFELKIQDNKNYLIKKNPNVKLDLATVGEGLGADAIASELMIRGYKNYMVNVAGASRSSGVNAKGEYWKLGIVDPNSSYSKASATVCSLGRAFATSGTYMNFFKDKVTGKAYSHVINPKNGYPVSHNTQSVTVVSNSAFESDALATALLVLGADKALEWGEKNHYAVATIEYKDGKNIFRNTSDFERHLRCGPNKKQTLLSKIFE
ncbi:thiamine biosynthesis lipoprotein [Succinivibrio dextrinosolvens DSM 3072]|uniref:FAD:protein FMN transferase n=1 Tax=Succinivibrio dextrinosolvens DSM 3072 TaxID=1123324 RepID=A0A1T4VWN8_9GAMM|nr:FAD:protein FMN transferase [Succinivibrio dextrinosolvens]SKA69319.1 thiamine biosynthesis lipoprotein [Succinivibrio dextrinosolvens DSM 3072]